MLVGMRKVTDICNGYVFRMSNVELDSNHPMQNPVYQLELFLPRCPRIPTFVLSSFSKLGSFLVDSTATLKSFVGAFHRGLCNLSYAPQDADVSHINAKKETKER